MNGLKVEKLEKNNKDILKKFGQQGEILGNIFKQASNKISNVSILYRI